ncbi:hypothetical protein [Priestia megaterium]|jgi:hypothetical protein|uniref:hypothetical protein n=1 Tax=Priestia megaterium TaxID=1404 RepID=UPI002813392C|nr:hypothetical protein [Priestia megaterium]MDR0128670.1 hypothetical protein [Priestia megaterium]
MRKGQLDEEEKKRKDAFAKHKCKNCVWSTWLNKNTIVFCGYPTTCVREEKIKTRT